MIRVLLVDDSPLALLSVGRALSTQPDIEIVGRAGDGARALKLIEELDPDLVCTDLRMPGLDGLGLTEAIVATRPRPVLVVTSDRRAEDVFRLMQAGALDVVSKPPIGSRESERAAGAELAARIRLLASVKVARRARPPRFASATARAGPRGQARERPDIVLVGASTGGPQALEQILRALPRDLPVPVVCVQHITPGFLEGLVKWLSGHTALEVAIARPGELPRAGHVYFPEERGHLLFDAAGRFQTSVTPPIDGHRPSVTATFTSAAERHGARALGVLLTGMGRDGAAGLAAIHRAGGATIAQDEATSLIFGMPAQAIALGAAQEVLGLDDIPTRVLGLLGVR